jgi:hypothetical protein
VRVAKYIKSQLLRTRLAKKFWYSAEGMLVRVITKRGSHSAEASSAVIFGRGLSLEHYPIVAPDVPDVLLANFSRKDFDSPTLRASLSNRVIHPVSNITEPVVPISKLRGVTIGDVYFCRPGASGSGGDEDRRTSFKLNRYGKKVEYFPPELAEGFPLYPNTGLLSIYLAVAGWGVKECWLFGFDFYENDYSWGPLVEQMGSDEAVLNQHKVGAQVKSEFMDLVNHFPKVQFRIYTYGNIAEPPANLFVEHLSN